MSHTFLHTFYEYRVFLLSFLGYSAFIELKV
jgi:hypothetical protein